jgi:uncharacterized membrane protein required for colicin V production
MYWLDIVILVMLGLGAGLGFWSGLLWQVARVVSLGLALYATILLNEPATNFLNESVRGIDTRVAQGAAYVAVFLAVFLTMFLLTRLLHKTIKATHLEMLDRLLGALLGSAKMSVLVALLCTGLAALSVPQTREWMSASKLAPLFVRATEASVAMIPDEYRSRANDSLQRFRDALRPGLTPPVAEEAAEPTE